MGWFRQQNDKIADTVLWHNGGTGGYRSYLAFTGDRRFGVVILSNTTQSPDALGRRILTELAATSNRLD
jgi:D-alanyl-D-alanine-carboxypeptidase/D-alanyl-D-alanine-endopeptidase